MNNDKKKLLIISSVIFAILLALFLFGADSSKIISAIVIAPLAVFTFFAIKKRGSLSINKREVLMLMTILAVIYVAFKEMSGIYFGFYKNPYFVNAETLIKVLIPTTVIIVATEVIRYVMVAQKNKVATVVTYLSCVLAEVLIYSNVAGIISFNRFMDLVGLTLFPAISANVFYHYISKNYGMIPNIVFRLITTLYIYFIPLTAGMEDALDSCIRIILPIALLAFVSAMFSKKQKSAIKKGKKLGAVSTVLTFIFVISVAMLISCQFRFGALVIATESMTGEINKGDMIIYERYENQNIKEGQVIVFKKNDSLIVHRVVRIENINGEVRYFTRGDANPSDDEGYRIDSEIVGLTDIKVAYIGYPTLWLRELLEGSN